MSGRSSISVCFRSFDSPLTKKILEEGQLDSIRLADVEDIIIRCQPSDIRTLYIQLQADARRGVIDFASGERDEIFRLTAVSESFQLRIPIVENESYKLSRFTFIRSDGTSSMVAENPKSTSRIIIQREIGIQLLHALREKQTIQSLQKQFPDVDSTELLACVELLGMAAMITRSDSDGQTDEEKDRVLKQWDFHDLLFHANSRLGRVKKPMGATFRFQNTAIKPTKAVRAINEDWCQVALPRPLRNGTDGVTLQTVLQERQSRRFNSRQITIEELSEFLFQCHRNISTSEEQVKRAYPSGGASYELEVYASVNSCSGLNRGFYYYSPNDHCLYLVQTPSADFEKLLYEAYYASAMNCFPQVLLTISSRFSRVSWKYEGIAYATQLKNLGVLIANMYLVATAMQLAPCALGLGDSERFCRLAGTNYLEESSIGEFMIGAK